MTRTLKVCGALFVVLALPFMLDAMTGCDFHLRFDPVLPNSYTCACDCKPQEHILPPTRVSAAFDDAEGSISDAVDLDLGVQIVGVRFVNLDIPQGASIVSATVQFTSDQDFEGDNTVPSNLDIYAIATGNASSFGDNVANLGSVNRTVASVGWQPPPWLLNQSGPAQQTPDLSPVIQEIVNRADWQSGNALALIFAGLGRREAVAFDRDPARAAVLSITFAEASPNPVSLQNLQVCVPQALNANEGGTTFSPADLDADCTGRVQKTLSDLALACHYPSACSCHVDGSSQWSQTCDDNNGVCVANPLPPVDCANFHQATNVPGDDPVCTANSPLAADVFGRRTTCAVKGTAQIDVGGNTQNSSTTGIVQFVGAPCPQGGCTVGMEYNLQFGSVTFGNFFASATFSNLAGVGENVAGNEAPVSPGGGATFSQSTLGASGQGSRGSDLSGLKGIATLNQDPVDVSVGWGQSMPMCSVNGALIGNVDPELKECDGGPDNGKPCTDDSQCAGDSSCGNDGVCHCVSVGTTDETVALNVTGNVINQPPTADAGPDQTVECTAAAVTNVVLDGSRSSDPDSNIALYSWLLGDLDGPEVGFEAEAHVQQALGTQTYVLRVIDAFGQADEDTTQVNVVDTTPPVVTCSVATPMLSPPNHDLVNVGLAASSVDQCEGVLPVVVNVFSNEDDQDNTGDGVFSPDAANIAVATLRLRAERKGNGDGRVYLIIPESTDSSGNRGFSCCTVTVPRSNAPAALLSVQSEAAAAQAYCLTHGGTAPSSYFVIGDGPVIGPKQ